MSAEPEVATGADADAIAAIFGAARAAAMPWLAVLHSAEEDRRFFAGVIADSAVLVVRRRERPVAFIALQDGLVAHLYVHPDCQREGIGSMLLDTAKARYPGGLRLWTFQRNLGARAFYARHGFVEAELTDGSDSEEREPDVLLAWSRARSSQTSSAYSRAVFTSAPPLLIAVPNVSEGRDRGVLELLEVSVGRARVLDVHIDADHNRAVFTLAGRQGELAEGLLGLAQAAVEHIDLRSHEGVHPHVGALDVMPVVWLDEERRGAASAEALTAAALVGERAGLPVFLYGDLATRPEYAERAWLRRGGPIGLAERLEAGELVPDYGPQRAHPSAGAVLATARRPLVAFNVDLVSDDVELAKSIAAELRESGGGLPGVRALGLYLADRGRAQVSTNVHDHLAVPLAEIVERVRARAPVAEAELIGLAPRAAFDGFPGDVPLHGFIPERHILEEALAVLH